MHHYAWYTPHMSAVNVELLRALWRVLDWKDAFMRVSLDVT